MTKPIHSMIRVMDEAKSVDFYRRGFGMRVADRYAFDGFTLVYLVSDESPFERELTINHGRTEPYAMGEAYGHIASSSRTPTGIVSKCRSGTGVTADPKTGCDKPPGRRPGSLAPRRSFRRRSLQVRGWCREAKNVCAVCATNRTAACHSSRIQAAISPTISRFPSIVRSIASATSSQ